MVALQSTPKRCTNLHALKWEGRSPPAAEGDEASHASSAASASHRVSRQHDFDPALDALTAAATPVAARSDMAQRRAGTSRLPGVDLPSYPCRLPGSIVCGLVYSVACPSKTPRRRRDRRSRAPAPGAGVIRRRPEGAQWTWLRSIDALAGVAAREKVSAGQVERQVHRVPD